jgi:hypothetical protein
VDGSRQERRLPGGRARRVRTGREGLLRPDPQGQGRQRGRGVRPSHAARRHDDRQADEGARLQPEDGRHDPRGPTRRRGRRTSARTATTRCWPPAGTTP